MNDSYLYSLISSCGKEHYVYLLSYVVTTQMKLAVNCESSKETPMFFFSSIPAPAEQVEQDFCYLPRGC